MFALSPLPRTITAALRDVASKRSEVRRSAIVDLVRHVDSADRAAIVEVLSRLLRSDPDPLVREVAVVASADGAVVELVPELLKSLEDPEPRVRQMVLLALGELAEASNVEIVGGIRPLLASPLPALRYQALVAWGRLARTGGMNELETALDDDDLEVRWVAWTLLEEIVEEWVPASSDALLERLRPRCGDPRIRIRTVAAVVLLRLGDPSEMTRLLQHVEDTSGIGRDDLVEVVRRFEPARNWLTQRARCGWFEGALGWPATVALAGLGDGAAENAILRELDSGSARRRGRALEAIMSLELVAAIDRVRLLDEQASGAEAWLVRETLSVLAKHRT